MIQTIDGVSFRMREPFDFSFLRRWGRVFKVYDDQDSGNICFGVAREGRRYFVKFAGAPTARAGCPPETAVANLKASQPLYADLRHPSLIDLVEAGEIGGGYAMVFRWAEGDCMGRMYPEEHARFMALSAADRMRVFRDILDFLSHAAGKGYVAIDFYDGSIMYDAATGKTTICDIDFFRKQPCVNDMGRMWGSSMFMSPEEFCLGAAIDERTNVYTLGAMAFALFGNYHRTRESWQLSDALFEAAQKAICEKRDGRQPSIAAFREEWLAAERSYQKGAAT